MQILTNLVLVALIGKSFSSTPSCGVRGKGDRAQIVGGQTALPLEFPWQVSLHLIKPPNTDVGHICGGSIISNQYINTAAHCIVDGYKSPSNYIVLVGEVYLNVTDPHEERIPVINITVHPSYNSTLINYDYALLKLARPLNFSGREKALMPICLPTPDQDFVGQTCTMTGWGLTKDVTQGGTVSQSLQKLDAPVVSYQTCKKAYQGINPVYRDTEICAGSLKAGEAACRGDSGGPLQCARPDGRYVLAGSNSWSGSFCAKAGQPSVFARISTRLAWIKSVVGPTP